MDDGRDEDAPPAVLMRGRGRLLGEMWMGGNSEDAGSAETVDARPRVAAPAARRARETVPSADRDAEGEDEEDEEEEEEEEDDADSHDMIEDGRTLTVRVECQYVENDDVSSCAWRQRAEQRCGVGREEGAEEERMPVLLRFGGACVIALITSALEHAPAL